MVVCSSRLLACALLWAVLAACAAAQGTPFLVEDIDTNPATSHDFGRIEGGATAGSLSIFLANDGLATQVWRTDGTVAATTLLATIPAARGSAGTTLAVARNGLCFFTAPSPFGGDRLWVTDGTPAGTLDIANGGRDPMSLTVDMASAATRIWFSATDSFNGRELWRSDGTAAGTVRVTQIRAGASSSMRAEPGQIACVASGVYFGANDGTNGAEVWRIVGGSIVVLFANLQPGAGQSLPEEFTSFGDRVVFSASGPSGREAYVITPGGLSTTLVDIRPGSGSSSPSHFVAVQLSATQAWFYCQADANNGMGRELWRYNAVTPGLSPIDLAPGATSSSPVATLLGTNLVVHPTGAAGLWGLPVGSISPVALLAMSTFPIGLSFTSPPTWLCLDTTTGLSWRTNGTVAGTGPSSLPGGFGLFTTPVLTLPGGTKCLMPSGAVLIDTPPTITVAALVPAGTNAGSEPRDLAAMPGGVVVFATKSGAHRSDGTTGGTFPIGPQTGNALRGFSPLFQGRRYFFLGRDLLATDGTAAGTVLVQANATPDTNDVAWAIAGTKLIVCRDGRVFSTTNLQPLLQLGLAVAPRPVNLGSVVIYYGDSATGGSEPWRTDGTVAGTWQVLDVNPGVGSSVPSGLPVTFVPTASGALVFRGFTQAEGLELWRTDGTSSGTFQIDAPAQPGSSGAVPDLVTATGDGRVLFGGSVPGGGETPWITDGTEAGTIQLSTTLGDTTYLGEYGGWILFRRGDQLCRTLGDAASTAAYYTGTLNGFAAGPAIAGGLLFYQGNALWITDGTAVGTTLLAGAPAVTLSNLAPARSFFAGAEIALFRGLVGGFGKPWRTDGTPAGTVRLANLAAEPVADSYDFVAAGAHVFFAAADSLHGLELWAMQTVSTLSTYSLGCPGSFGVVPQITATPPKLGTLWQIEVQTAPANAAAFLVLGFSAASTPLGGGCTLLASGEATSLVLTSPTGIGTYPMLLPNDAGLLGLSLFAQYAPIDPNGAFANTLSFSGGLQGTLGY